MKGLNEDQLKDRHGEKSEELRRQLKEKDSILKGYRDDHGKLELFFSAIQDAIKPTPVMPVMYKPPKKSTSVCEAVMQISDAHMGAVQMGDEIEHFNSFDPEICERRQMNYVEQFLNWIETHRQGWRIDNLTVLVTGDLISGDIHDELKITNAFPSPVQCVRAAEVLIAQLSTLAPHFNHITVHFILEDNHARLVKKPQAKEAGMNNFNYVIGKMAQMGMQLYDHVEINLYPQFEKVVPVLNRRYLISHGHGGHSWMGIPWYDIQRRVGKEANSRLSLIMEDTRRALEIGFHKYVFGHYHTPFDHPLYSCCGSVSGTDAYDHKAGRHAAPSQSSWIVHPVYREFDRINFTL